MKDIFELLNGADVTSVEQVDAILTKKEQDKIFQIIMLKDEEKKSMKKGMKRALVSAAVLAVIVSATVCSPALKTIASNILTYFTGNTKTDYAKEVHETVEQDNGSMELLSVSREERIVHLKVKFEFKEDVSELADLCGEYKLPGLIVTEDGKLTREDGTVLEENVVMNEDGTITADRPGGQVIYIIDDVYGDYNAPEEYVLFAPPFINSKILVNGVDYMNMSVPEEIDKENFPIYLISVRNVEISGNTLIQNIVLYLQDLDYQEDINISFQYKDIVLSERTVEGEWNLDYTISGNDYEDSELNKMPIELSATDSNGATYTLESYSVTPGGIKIYGQDDNYEKMTGQVLVRIVAYDDLGNKYLMYPVYEDMKYFTYTIYDGPAGDNDEYLVQLDKNAKTLTIAFEQLYQEVDDNDHFIGEEQATLISEELTLAIERNE